MLSMGWNMLYWMLWVGGFPLGKKFLRILDGGQGQGTAGTR